MKTSILTHDEATRTVSARFEQDDIVHDRPVNACYAQDGSYDVVATEARVAEVGNGVAVKIGLGLIVAHVEPEPASDAE